MVLVVLLGVEAPVWWWQQSDVSICGSNLSYVSKNICGNKKNSRCGSNSSDVMVALGWAGDSGSRIGAV
jgi:hypothetical protein